MDSYNLRRWIRARLDDPEEGRAEIVNDIQLQRIAFGLREIVSNLPPDGHGVPHGDFESLCCSMLDDISDVAPELIWLAQALDDIAILKDDPRTALLGRRRPGRKYKNALRDWHIAFEAHQCLKPNGKLSEGDAIRLGEKYDVDESKIRSLHRQYRRKLEKHFATR